MFDVGHTLHFSNFLELVKCFLQSQAFVEENPHIIECGVGRNFLKCELFEANFCFLLVFSQGVENGKVVCNLFVARLLMLQVHL